MKIGVITDCFKKSHFDGIELAAQLGLQGVQIQEKAVTPCEKGYHVFLRYTVWQAINL